MTPFLLAILVGVAAAQQDDGAPAAVEFECPEPNGKFADFEQCDLYYICRDGVATAELCPDGLLFNDKIPNREKCELPFEQPPPYDVECGERVYVQEPSPDRDPKCERANGKYNHPDENECQKYIQCDNGRPYEFPCANTLYFNSVTGNCVTEAELAKYPEARTCTEEKVYEIDGFTCPGGEAVGPQNLLQAHPIYPHPNDCRYYFSCYHNKEPNKFGCSEGQVFAADTQQCKPPEEVPECACWYQEACPKDCPDCNPDCSCPTY